MFDLSLKKKALGLVRRYGSSSHSRQGSLRGGITTACCKRRGDCWRRGRMTHCKQPGKRIRIRTSSIVSSHVTWVLGRLGGPSVIRFLPITPHPHYVSLQILQISHPRCVTASLNQFTHTSYATEPNFIVWSCIRVAFHRTSNYWIPLILNRYNFLFYLAICS